MPEFLGGGARFAAGGQAFDHDADFSIIEHAAVDAAQLRVERDAARKFFQERPPEEAAVDNAVEDLGCADDAVQLGGAFLGAGNFRFDLGPIVLRLVEAVADFEHLVGVPKIIDEHDRAESAEHHHADLERIALALALLEDFLVEEVEVESHERALVPQVLEGRAAGDIHLPGRLRES